MGNRVTVVAEGQRDIVITRIFDAPRALVFDALTKPELVQQWLTGPEGWRLETCSIDLRERGAFRYEWKGEGERSTVMSGVYREIAAPERIVQTESFDPDWTGGEAVSRAQLVPIGEVTRLTITITYASGEARDQVIRSNLEVGQAAAFARLDHLLSQQ